MWKHRDKFKIEFRLSHLRVTTIPSTIEDGAELFLEWKIDSKTTGTTKRQPKHGAEMSWDDPVTFIVKITSEGHEKYSKKEITIYLCQEYFSGGKRKVLRLGKLRFDLSLHARVDASGASKFCFEMENKKSLTETPWLNVTIQARFLKLNHKAMVPVSDKDAAAANVPSIVIDGKTFQLRDADDHMESTVGTASDDTMTDPFDDERSEDRSIRDSARDISSNTLSPDSAAAARTHRTSLSEQNGELRRQLDAALKLAAERLLTIQQLESSIAQLRAGTSQTDKSPILDQLLEENENLKLQLKDLQRQLAEHSKKEAQHHGRDVDAERRTQEYEKRLAEQAATIEELQRRVKASAAYEQTIREQEAVIRSLSSSSNPSALSHLYRPFAILMFIFTVCAVIIKVW